MDELFSLFIQRISEWMPELTLVDEDYGQLEAGLEEETYPVTFPCVLIGNLEADWENLQGWAAGHGIFLRPSRGRLLRRYALRIGHGVKGRRAFANGKPCLCCSPGLPAEQFYDCARAHQVAFLFAPSWRQGL